jgi:hypothetical protein
MEITIDINIICPLYKTFVQFYCISKWKRIRIINMMFKIIYIKIIDMTYLYEYISSHNCNERF